MTLRLPGATVLAHDRVTGSVSDPTMHPLPKIDTPAVLLVIARAVAGGADLSITLETLNAAGETVAVPGATFALADGVIAQVATIPDDKLGASARATITNGDAGVYDVLVALIHDAKYANAVGAVLGLALLDTTPSAGSAWLPAGYLLGVGDLFQGTVTPGMGPVVDGAGIGGVAGFPKCQAVATMYPVVGTPSVTVTLTQSPDGLTYTPIAGYEDIPITGVLPDVSNVGEPLDLANLDNSIRPQFVVTGSPGDSAVLRIMITVVNSPGG